MNALSNVYLFRLGFLYGGEHILSEMGFALHFATRRSCGSDK